MILGFLGKGGSGKSSLATQATLFLHREGKLVMAIDADHNMDLAHNLTQGMVVPEKYLSEARGVLESEIGIVAGQMYGEAFVSEIQTRFSVAPLTPILEPYVAKLRDRLLLMIAGPQNDAVLYGQLCSHSLSTPLKILLPLLVLKENEVIVVDEKAGADGVSTGIVTGIDVGVIVCEPAFHSIKAGKQIAGLMDFYGTPYVFVGNKIASVDDRAFLENELGVPCVAYFEQHNSIQRNPGEVARGWESELEKIVQSVKHAYTGDRLERTKHKFRRNVEFAQR